MLSWFQLKTPLRPLRYRDRKFDKIRSQSNQEIPIWNDIHPFFYLLKNMIVNVI